MNIQPITEQLITRQQIQQFNFGLAEIMQEVFSTKKSFEKLIYDALPLYMAQGLLDCLTKNSINTKNSHEVKQAILQISEMLAQLPTVGLTLAWEPTAGQLEHLVDWIRQAQSKTVLLDVTVNAAIFAGAIIEYNGKYGDYTLRSKIQMSHEKI